MKRPRWIRISVAVAVLAAIGFVALLFRTSGGRAWRENWRYERWYNGNREAIRRIKTDYPAVRLMKFKTQHFFVGRLDTEAEVEAVGQRFQALNPPEFVSNRVGLSKLGRYQVWSNKNSEAISALMTNYADTTLHYHEDTICIRGSISSKDSLTRLDRTIRRLHPPGGMTFYHCADVKEAE